MAEPAGTTDPVEVGVGLAREIEVDHDVYGNDIDTTGENIRRDETASFTTLEVVEDSIEKEVMIKGLSRTIEAGYKLTGFCPASPSLSE